MKELWNILEDKTFLMIQPKGLQAGGRAMSLAVALNIITSTRPLVYQIQLVINKTIEKDDKKYLT